MFANQETKLNEDQKSGLGETLNLTIMAFFQTTNLLGIALEHIGQFGGASPRGGSWSSSHQSDSRGSQGDSGTEDHTWVNSQGHETQCNM